MGSHHHQAPQHRRQGSSAVVVMKLPSALVLLVIVTFGEAAPLIFAASIIKGSTVFRGIYGLLGIQPENIFTTEAPLRTFEDIPSLENNPSFEENFFDYINNN